MTYMNRYRLIYTLLLTALMASTNASAGVTVKGNVYGGGNLADVKTNTQVNMGGGTVAGNVYGGGKGTGENSFTCEKAMVGVDGEGLTDNNGGTTVRIGNGTVGTSLENGTLKTGTGNVYGGGEVGRVEKNTVVIIGIEGDDNSKPVIKGDVFGAGEGLPTHGYSALVRGNSSVTVQGGAKVKKSVYGGGEIATVGRYIVVDGYPTEPNGGGICTVVIKDKAEISGNVVGAGKGITPSNYSSSQHVIPSGAPVSFNSQAEYLTFLETLALASETQVTIGGTTASKTAIVKGNVYGGSESGFLQRHTQVTVLDNCQIGTADAGGNVYGGGKGLSTFADAGRVSGYTKVFIKGGITHGSVFGGGELGYIKGGANVNMTGGTVGTIENGTLKAGTGDVYGGGALADTNIGNGNEYIAVPGIITGASVTGLYEKKYKTTGDATAVNGKTYYELKSGLYVVKNGLKAGESSVTGLYEIDIKETSDVTAALGKTYYEYKTDRGIYAVKNGLTVGQSITNLYEIDYGVTSDVAAIAGKSYYTLTHTTNVNLLGGTILRDAYGGGLGSSTVAALVYGDTKVNLNGMAISEYSSDFSSYVTALDVNNDNTNDYYMVPNTTGKKGCIVNRVFGCNNLNGTPKGNVSVNVYATQNKSTTTIGSKVPLTFTEPETDKLTYWTTQATSIGLTPKTVIGETSDEGEKINLLKAAIESNRYDMKAVYGGGNEAAYIPATPYHPTEAPTGSKTHVVIHGCNYTSIETVYGGGNAAPTPETNVDIYSSYEIDNAFGGGNGKDRKESNNAENPGANVGMYNNGTSDVRYGTGNTTTWIYGGTVHEAYGGSNERGTIYGRVTIDVANTNPDNCPLNVTKIVGAGKNADVNGDLILIMGCKPETKIPLVYGGADNANVNGNVELTIISGNFGKVFGGNNEGGVIKGHIILNIEETGNCETPITIDELYLGGNMAEYSMYGYYQDGTTSSGKPIYKSRKSATDSHLPTDYAGNDVAINAFTNYEPPVLNIVSCTRIGEVFGGGYGTGGDMYADPTVNINMIPGALANIIDRDGTPGPDDSTGKLLGAIGDVFGGGNAANVYGNTTVNIGTAKTIEMTTEPLHLGNDGYSYNSTTKKYENVAVQGAYITGNVYGGGKLANVTGNTYVNICAKEDDDLETTDVIEYKGVYITGTNNQGVTIKGDVFGGGKGVTEDAGVTGAFECAKAMVGVDRTNDGTIDIMKEVTSDGTSKGTRVSIGNGTIEGTVYGGGEIGRVEWNGVVTVGLPVGSGETSAPEIKHNVFGGGKGVEQYGYAALMRGNTFVTVQANAKVGKSVYGGGEIASVGKYQIASEDNIKDDDFMAAHPGIEKGMPYSLANEKSGYCNVTVRGNAEIGPDDMRMYYDGDKAPDDEGHVFGAGKGILPYENKDDFKCQASGHNGAKHPGRMSKGDVWECYNDNEAKYLRFIETQALATHTEVLVGDDAFVKGSVYGGSLSGHVQHDTHVTIADRCQIGAGYDSDNNQSLPKYNHSDWPTNTQNITESWAECAHWPYSTSNDMPYDPYAKYLYNGEYYYDEDHEYSSNGGSNKGTDGHTYYGNVFGGGSGVVPYAAGKWHREAGTVGGNTVVDIIGGHILTSVYGGNEHTDVGTYDPNTRALVAGTGKCTVNMTGGTVGVPRTKEDIALHPVTCYVFGAGKGDQRNNFNTWTNIGEAQVNISGNARIYGSTFGGGEDGHVLGDVETNVGGTVKIGNTNHNYPTIDESNPGVIIGTQGLSGADGNIFGGGRGFSEQALTAGVVCGNVTVNIHNGKMLGSIFGGGRLASVGTYLVPATGTGSKNYGKLQPDASAQDATYYTAEDDEVIAGTKEVGDVKTPAVTASSHGHISINIYGGTIGATYAEGDNAGKLVSSEFSIGDVFGGCKGSGNNKHFGLAKKTIINMSGGTVNGNVYGGGELGYVGEATLNATTNVYEWSEESAGGGLCTVDISGGSVAGHVFGAGKGKADDFECEKALVRATSVTIRKSGTTGTTIGGNVYGGGEVGRVDQSTMVTIGNKGTNEGAGEFGGTDALITGSVFGAGAGKETHGYSALVRGNASVTVQGNAKVGNSVYGGGMIASVGQYGLDHNFMPETLKGDGECTVTVKGYAEIGSLGEGHVFGAGKGVNPFDAAHNYINYTNNPEDPDNKKKKPKRMTKTPGEGKPWPALYDNVGDGSEFIWEYYTSQEDYFKFLQTLALGTDTYVTIDGNASVHGNVYGGSESGFVQKETDVKIQGSDNNITTDGNVFGGGKGVSGFDKAGRVRGNTKTAISGGTINGNVYGGGELGHVGKFNKTNDGRYIMQTIQDKDDNTINTGLCTVSITGGKVGPDNNTDKDKGNVFGAGKGKDDTFKCEKAMAMNTSVSVSGGTVNGNVYGGGEIGRVEYDTEVTIGRTSTDKEDAVGTGTPDIKGSVFGAGRGVKTHGYSALVRGNTKVTIDGADGSKVGHSVYGGGEIASVGRYGLNAAKMPEILLGASGFCTVKVQGHATIGPANSSDEEGNVYGAGKGVDDTDFNMNTGDKSTWSRRMVTYDPYNEETHKGRHKDGEGGNKGTLWWPCNETELTPVYVWEYFPDDAEGVENRKTGKEKYKTYLETLALATHPEVTIDGDATVNSSVFGGGEVGLTKGSVIVTIKGGTIVKDVYGGGALANTNTTSSIGKLNEDGSAMTDASGNIVFDDGIHPTTTVNLKGGTVNHNVYGGGLGQLAKAGVDGVHYTQEEIDAAQEGDAAFGKTTGDWKVEPVESLSAIEAKVYGNISVKLNETIATDNCEVKGTIFGCNNLNGSPQAGVDVHVYKTVKKESGVVAEKEEGTYEVTAVYGGGNLAAYYPDDATIRENATAYVTIDGCKLTSIGSVYGGGNAASVPATEVVINGTYEIGEAFGGGNGKDRISYDGTNYEDNPGANVGLRAYPDANNLPYDTKQNRDTNYGYGPGKSHITIYGGTVHSVYGGSNLRGNVRVESRTTLEDADNGCDFNVGKAYGGGNNAPQDGDAVLEIGCISGLEKAYGGASNADVNGDVVLNITNGTYGRVFGGNDLGGNITGSITVNIEETGCRPIIIGELYGGGNEAGYSIYGYKKVTETVTETNKETGKTTTKEVQVWRPRESSTDSPEGVELSIPDPLPKSPQVNVKSFTSIGTVYGGGYGGPATMVGNPEVNINVVKGRYATGVKAIDGYPKDNNGNDITKVGGVDIPSHTLGAIGAINNVFGGGNAAEVIGTPHVNIGTLTGEVITLASKKIEDSEGKAPTDEGWIPSYQLATAEGVDIRGNVYGAGNNAPVTGDTEVVIGKNKDVKTYIFKSFSEETGGTAWSSGLAQTTGVTKNGNAEVVILSNGKYTNFVGQKYYVAPDATTNGSTRTALKDASGNTTGLWVAISEHKIYNFTSYGASTGGTQYSTGTAAPTGNFKTIDGQEYMQIQVLTNPGETSWEGKTFFIITTAKTDGTRYQLYKANGTKESVWVEITE